MQIITDINKAPHEPLAITVGFFDGVHRGHRFMLDTLKQIAGEKGLKTAVLTFKDHPRKALKSDFIPELLTTADERIALLAEMDIDYCVLLDFTPEIWNLTAETFIKTVLHKQLNVSVLLIGYDNRIGKDRTDSIEHYIQYGKEVGMSVLEAEEMYCEGKQVSSSEIRRLMNEGDMVIVNKLLGKNYCLEGKVVHGNHIGKTLGYPTANLQVNGDKKIPPRGVYAVWVNVGGKRYKGMLNIGVRPTVMPDSQTYSIEVSIIDFEKDIYNETLTVEFVKKLRDEKKFDNLTALSEQLEKDRKETVAIVDKYTNQHDI